MRTNSNFIGLASGEVITLHRDDRSVGIVLLELEHVVVGVQQFYQYPLQLGCNSGGYACCAWIDLDHDG